MVDGERLFSDNVGDFVAEFVDDIVEEAVALGVNENVNDVLPDSEFVTVIEGLTVSVVVAESVEDIVGLMESEFDGENVAETEKVSVRVAAVIVIKDDAEALCVHDRRRREPDSDGSCDRVPLEDRVGEAVRDSVEVADSVTDDDEAVVIVLD